MREYQPIEGLIEAGYCGPAVLAAAAKQQGIEITQRELADVMGTTEKLETSHEDMMHGAFEAGMNFIAQERLNLGQLNAIRVGGFSVILNWMDGDDDQNDGHYSLLEDLTPKEIVLNDPSNGGEIRRFSRHEFEQRWFDINNGKVVRNWSMILRRPNGEDNR